MRISVYVQCFSCILLLGFPTAHELVKSSFRNSILTTYALGFAFIMAHHTDNYSLQSVLVAHCFVDILLLSAFALLCFRPALHRNRNHYIMLAGGIPFALWTLVQAGTRKTECALEFQTISVDRYTFQLYKGFWAISVLVYAFTLPILTLHFFPKACAKFETGLKRLAVLSWFLASVATVTVSEVTLSTGFTGDPAHPRFLGKTEWTFGQVFAVVMLFFIVWDLAMYPFQRSEEINGSRFRYWWDHRSTWSLRRLIPGKSSSDRIKKV